MNREIKIGNHIISENTPCFIVAEMSANHNMDYDRAVAIIRAAKEAGADAVKIQTYTADTITLNCDDDCFQITQQTLWDGTTLHKLYETAYTPWEWQGKLRDEALNMGLEFFSSPFDGSSVDFLEELGMPAYKVASFEITDIPLIRKLAKLGKPIGSDKENGTSTYVSLLGLENAKKEACRQIQLARLQAEKLEDSGFLIWLADLILNRDH